MVTQKIQRLVFTIGILIAIFNHPNFPFLLSAYSQQPGGNFSDIVRVMQQDTSVYRDSTSWSAFLNLTLDFDTRVKILADQGARVQVSRLDGHRPLGWVERSALLFRTTPLKGNSGLEQKLYIKTATEVRCTKLATVRAYPSPDLQGRSDQCHELSRFTGYFVFAETPDGYLIGDSYRLDDTAQLVGWVGKENAFLWDTAYGLRPREDLAFPEGYEKSGEEKAVCAYQTIEAALTDPVGKCLPILGGKRWYTYPDRIPILEWVRWGGKDFYKVILSVAGTGAKYGYRPGTIKIHHPGQISELQGINSLFGMKYVDVFFLIDGTESMTPYIEAVRGSPINNYQDGVVQQIIRTLQVDEAFQETQFRFGFRIYRDRYAGQWELGEGLPLSDRCELTREAQQRNLSDFHYYIANIRATQYDNDDYPENLFGGIQQAIYDLFPCPDNTKLLFVIGDCGYDAYAQREYGTFPIPIQKLIDQLRGDIQQQQKNVVVFFLQTPSNREAVIPWERRQHYDYAYELFNQQAHELLSSILQPNYADEIENYFMITDDTELTDKILAGVKQFSNMEPIHELVLDLQGGAALMDTIQRLQGNPEYKNIPGLFWELVKQGSCRQLGPQCYERVYDTIIEGYIPVSDDIIEEVWLKRDDLRTWEHLLSAFKDMSYVSGSKLREAFVEALKDSLEKILRRPLYEETSEPLHVYVRRKMGLPVRDTSPLLQYSIDDLRDSRTVPDCEIIRLTSWVNHVKQMLGIISHGDLRPVFDVQPFPGECPSAENIPFISSDIRSAPIGSNPNMRYDHSFQKTHVYWVPEEYLP